MITTRVAGLYYITHVDNLASILEHGVLSHAEIARAGLPYRPIYDEQIVDRRKGRQTPDRKSLWEYANFYFTARNPMLYRVIREKGTSQLVILRFKTTLLNEAGVWITDGNAAHSLSRILPATDEHLKQIQPFLNLEFWSEEDGSKRKIMAECLVPNRADAKKYLDTVYVSNGLRERVEDILKRAKSEAKVVLEPRHFFEPNYSKSLEGTKIKLIQGDMFLSQAQTLTISVNTVGVMGKGLASRAKYQFPDIYVVYEDLCRKKRLVVGKPELVKRETSLADKLSDQPIGTDQATWFLLFPTKQHWREHSQLSYIVDGLAWLKEHLHAWGITSMALPALGCGLGGLTWQQVGPLMCQFALSVNIPVMIYLPSEDKQPEEFLTKEFLLKQ